MKAGKQPTDATGTHCEIEQVLRLAKKKGANDYLIIKGKPVLPGKKNSPWKLYSARTFRGQFDVTFTRPAKGAQ